MDQNQASTLRRYKSLTTARRRFVLQRSKKLHVHHCSHVSTVATEKVRVGESAGLCADHLPVSAVLQSVAYLIFGLKQDVLELGGDGPADRQLVLELADAIDLHVGGRVCGHCTHKGHLLKGLHAAGVKSNKAGMTSKR